MTDEGFMSGLTVEDLETGPQPETLEEWIGQLVGAASALKYGPLHPENVFDEESANALVDWAVAGIRRLGQHEETAAAPAPVVNSSSAEWCSGGQHVFTSVVGAPASCVCGGLTVHSDWERAR